MILTSLLLAALPSFAASWPDLSQAPGALGGGEKDAAVIIGAENYPFIERIPGARRNAEDWQAYLTGALKVPADRVALLRDNDATLEEMRRYAFEKAGQVEPGGTLWFVFIGHGAPSKDGKDGLLVGVDAQQKAESVYARSLSRNELLTLLASGKQARAVVLIDACFSGKSGSGQSIVKGLQPLVTMGALPKGMDARTVLLTAARADQFAGPLPKAERMRPAFSYLALGGLRGWAADSSGKVTAQGVVEFARKALSLARDRTQTPELAAGAGTAVLGRGKESAPDLAAIDRENSAGGMDFQVSDLPAIARAQAPKALEAGAGELDFRNLDIGALKKYNSAIKLDKSGATPVEKAEIWRALAVEAPKFAAVAEKRAAEWDLYASQEAAAKEAAEKRAAARDSDWGKLSQLLELDDVVVPKANKARWAAEFAKAYLQSPGIEPAAAKDLLPYVESGPMNKALKDLAGKIAAVVERAEAESEELRAYREFKKKQDTLARGKIFPSGLIYASEREGAGRSPGTSDKVRAHYEGTLADGTVFDSSYKRGEPLEFQLDGVIRCWAEGIQLMKEGGKAVFVCPPDIAYGSAGSPPVIPPDATLTFKVELVEVVRPVKQYKK